MREFAKKKGKIRYVKNKFLKIFAVLVKMMQKKKKWSFHDTNDRLQIKPHIQFPTKFYDITSDNVKPPIEMSCVLVRQSIHRLLVFLVNVKGFYSTKLSTLCRYLECVYQFLFLTKLVLNETSFSLCCTPFSILDQVAARWNFWFNYKCIKKNFLKRSLYIFFYGTIILKLLYVRFRILEFFKFILYKNYTKFVDKCIKFSELLGKNWVPVT